MALGKVIGLDAGASWNPSIAIIPTYVTNFTTTDDPVELYVSTESNGTVTAAINNTTYYTISKVNNKLFLVNRTSTTSGYDAESTTATITITVAADTEQGYASMTRTVTIGPDNYQPDTGDAVKPLNNSANTPEVIKNAIASGAYKTLWSVGENTSEIVLGKGGSVTVGAKTFNNTGGFCAYILGFNHNNTKTAGVTETTTDSIHFSLSRRVNKLSADAHVAGDIAFVDTKLYLTGSDAGFRMNLTNSNSGGWEKSYMRTVICAQFYSAIDPAWRACIGSVRKWTDNVGGATDTSTNVTPTWDRIFLMAEFEIFGARSYANSSEQSYQQQYDYYKNNSAASYRIRGADASNASGLASEATNVAAGAAVHWWERSPINYTYNEHTICLRTGAQCYLDTPLAISVVANYWHSMYAHGFVPNFVMTA